MIDDQLSSHAHLENADQRKFGSALKGLQSQKSLENDQFKRTAPKARSLLSVFDDQKKEEKWKPKDKRGDKHNSRKTSASTC